MRVSSPWLNYTQLWSKASTQLIQTGAAVAGSAVASVPRSDGDWVQLLPRWAAAPGSWPQHRTCTCPPHQAVPHLTTYHTTTKTTPCQPPTSFIQGPSKWSSKSIWFWGPLKCTKLNFNPMHIFSPLRDIWFNGITMDFSFKNEWVQAIWKFWDPSFFWLTL